MIDAAPAPSVPFSAALPDAAQRRLHACAGCGLLQRMPDEAGRGAVRCARCNALLRRERPESVIRGLPFILTGLLLFLLATQLDFMTLDVRGRMRDTLMMTGPIELQQRGYWEIAAAVAFMTFLAPLGRLALLAWVLLGLRSRSAPVGLPVAMRWAEGLRPWSMIDVYMIGLFVAYTKIIDLAHVEIGGAVIALGILMLLMAAGDVRLDRHAVWEAIEARGAATGRRGGQRSTLAACPACERVTDAADACPRCGAAIEQRKPQSLTRTWSLLAAAAILYLPANLLPVLTYTSLGRGAPSTILGGAIELFDAGMWPLTLVVLFASVLVPVLKLVVLSALLVATHLGTAWRLRERTALYRIVDFIGRWSMIDVFVVSILTALVRMDRLAEVDPGPGIISFCAVVILTMLAAESFDPRLMWDAAAARERRRRAAAPGPGLVAG